MLDTLKAADFEPYIGTNVNIVIPGGTDVTIKLEDISEKKSAMMPQTSEDTRTPFSLVFTGPLESVFESGCYNVKQEKIGTMENIYISRIAPFSNEAAAWYEIIFN